MAINHNKYYYVPVITVDETDSQILRYPRKWAKNREEAKKGIASRLNENWRVIE